MEVLRPSLVYIGNRCYRKNIVATANAGAAAEFDEEDFSYSATVDDYAEESCSIDVDDKIEKLSTGYQLSLDLPSAYFKYVIGKNGETKKRLETETRTQIRIPRQNEVQGNIVITGSDRSGIRSARTRIDVIAMSSRRFIPFTHFLSIPVVGSNVQTAFNEFKEDVLRNCVKDRGIDGTIFQNRGKLHMTLGTMVLLTDADIEKAANFLTSCQQELTRTVLRNEPMVADIHGLEYMNDDPGAVDVLYAKVLLTDGSNRLQTFADGLVDRFVAAGLMQREHDRVKLHITVMNSLMRKDPSGTTVPLAGRQPVRAGQQWTGNRNRENFDASNVLRLLGDYQFGEHHLDMLHISQRYSATNDEYYVAAAKVTLP